MRWVTLILVLAAVVCAWKGRVAIEDWQYQRGTGAHLRTVGEPVNPLEDSWYEQHVHK